MESDRRPKEEKRSAFNFRIAFAFLVAMALSWSVDASLVIIFLGIATFFAFMGFIDTRKAENSPRARSYSGDSTKDSLRMLVNQLFTTFRKHADKSTVSRSANGEQIKGMLAKLIGLAVFSFLFIVTVVSIFFSDDGASDAREYYQLGEQYYLMQEYDSAYINYKRALELDPGYQDAMVGFANVFIAREMPDSALAILDQALEADPSFSEATFRKAIVYYNQRKFGEGIEILGPLIASDPSYYEAILLMGDFYYMQSQYDQAITWYEEAYQHEEARSRILCHIMAYIYDTKGNYEKAIDLYKEALYYDSAIVDIYKRLGELIPDESGSFFRSRALEMGK